MQVVSLAAACLRRGRGIVLHELMHVLGFWHEHARADRDRYIRVNWNEILPGERAWSSGALGGGQQLSQGPVILPTTCLTLWGRRGSRFSGAWRVVQLPLPWAPAFTCP